MSQPGHGRTQSSTSDDWQQGTLVDDFPNDEGDLPDWDPWQTQSSTASSSSTAAPASSSSSSSTSTQSGLPRLPSFRSRRSTGPSSSNAGPSSQSPLSPPSTKNQADEDFFAALERAGSFRSPPRPSKEPSVSTSSSLHLDPTSGNGSIPAFNPMTGSPIPPAARPPSPPMIDLRPEERRIRQRERIKEGGIDTTEEEDWFAAFERGQGGSLKQQQSEEEDRRRKMDADQLESMKEATVSPLPLPTPDQQRLPDYFGDTTASGSSLPQARSSKSGSRLPAPPPTSRSSSSSWWGSLRGLGTSLATSAVDYLDPGVDFSDEEVRMARKMGALDLSSKEGTPVPSRSGTPALRGNSSTTAGQSTQRPTGPSKRTATGSSGLSSTFVSGAPGVDFSQLNPHWNTGSWSLASDDPTRIQQALAQGSSRGGSPSVSGNEKKSTTPRFRDPMPVHLTLRREETTPVITDFHASHLQSYLPPRLKLGKTWRLLYSSDQDGVSLETLYRKVQIGLDPKRAAAAAGNSNTAGNGEFRFEVDRRDDWLRGSSQAVKAALGSEWASSPSTSSSRLGSGLTSLSDAGLILAIRDTNDQVFGAYSNEAFKNVQKSYYGNGDCFLWRSISSRKGQIIQPHIKTYPSTLRNNYHIQSTSSYLSMGAGVDGHYGLWVDEAFEKGITGKCETFENGVLCDDRLIEGEEGEGVQEKFEPMVVEVWAVGMD